MPPRGQGPRLWLRKARRDKRGTVTHPAVWLIIDGHYQQSTRCGVDDRQRAEQALADYINRKHIDQAAREQRRPSEIPIADVLAVYGRHKAVEHSRPRESGQRMKTLLAFFGDKALSQINGDLCRRYAAQRSTDAAARRELEDLRAAVNHYQREGLVREKITVWLPRRRPARERWLTRSEAARLVLSAWHYRERQNGEATDRRPRQHVAKFILVALYAGRRAGAITEAALQPTPGRGWIDTQRGVFYPRPGLRQSKKRQPPIMLPRRLLAHLRRWKRQGQKYVIEWNGQPIGRMAKAFRHAVRDAGFGPEVTPHVLRHTSATWLMQRGAPPWAASGYLGMSIETLERVYGHHHPDHQKGAWSVFDRPGGEPKATIKPGARRKPTRRLKRRAAIKAKA